MAQASCRFSLSSVFDCLVCSGFSDLCNGVQRKAEIKICAFLACCGQTTALS